MEPEQVNIAISRIKELEYFIDESIGLQSNTSININFQVTTNIKPEDKTVEMLFTAQFAKGEDVLLKIKTSNVFTVLELAEFYKSGDEIYVIPDNLMVTFLSLSVTHTRALLAKNTQGTKFADLYIPIVNPTNLFNQLFKA